jgi:hypothetical protein
VVLGAAVEGHCQNTGNGGFADATVPAEDVSMRDSPLLDCILERTGDVLLPDNIGELLRSVFAGQNLIAHRQKLRLYGAGLWKSRHAVEDKFTTENTESTAKMRSPAFK